MVEIVELGGKGRPILFGTAAFRIYKERTKNTLTYFVDALGSGDMTVISDITYCALRVGERYQKNDSEVYDELDVAIWIDLYPGGAVSFLERVMKSLPSQSEGEGGSAPGEPKTIGTGTNLSEPPGGLAGVKTS